MTIPSRFLAIAGASALALVALSGCSLLPNAVNTTSASDAADPGDSQSARDACLQIKPSLQSVATEVQGAYGDLQSDPSSAIPLFQKVSAEYRGAIAELDNQEVIDVTTTAADSLDAMTTSIQAYLDGSGSQADLLAAGTQVSTDFSAIDTVCSKAVDG